MNFGERLTDIRRKLGFNQVDFSEKLGLTQQSLSRYEKNKNIPSIEFVQKLTNIFDINLNWLLIGKGEKFLKDEKNITVRESEMLRFFNKLSPKKQDYYFYQIVADALKDEIDKDQ